MISPLRTPRERHWPTPITFKEPTGLISPTTAHTFDVPISKPTMMDEESNMFLFAAQSFQRLGSGRRRQARIEPARGHIICHGEIHPRHVFARPLPIFMHDAPPAELSFHVREPK